MDPLERIAPTKPGRPIVIPDVRFTNEISKLRKLKAHNIHITRPGNYDLVNTEDLARNHVSETELNTIPSKSFSIHINNNGTLVDLHRKVHETLDLMRLLKA